MRQLNLEKAFNLRFTDFDRKDDMPTPRDLAEPIPSGNWPGGNSMRRSIIGCSIGIMISMAGIGKAAILEEKPWWISGWKTWPTILRKSANWGRKKSFIKGERRKGKKGKRE